LELPPPVGGTATEELFETAAFEVSPPVDGAAVLDVLEIAASEDSPPVDGETGLETAALLASPPVAGTVSARTITGTMMVAQMPMIAAFCAKLRLFIRFYV
jgi:hypothetical protein